jgi:hypothetical protein
VLEAERQKWRRQRPFSIDFVDEPCQCHTFDVGSYVPTRPAIVAGPVASRATFRLDDTGNIKTSMCGVVDRDSDRVTDRDRLLGNPYQVKIMV